MPCQTVSPPLAQPAPLPCMPGVGGPPATLSVTSQVSELREHFNLSKWIYAGSVVSSSEVIRRIYRSKIDVRNVRENFL